MDPIRAYDGKAEDYAAHRAPFSPAAIRTLVETTGIGPRSVVADLGSGTGHLTRHLLDHAATVFAIEPNAGMRREAERELGGHPAFVSVSGLAEQVPLRTGSVDLIAAGQAVHWFDRERIPLEWARVLRPEGWVACIGNGFGGFGVPDLDWLLPATEHWRFSFPACTTGTWEQYMAAMRSSAYAPTRDDPSYPEYEAEQRRRFEDGAVDGVLSAPYSTELCVGRLSRG